MKLKYIYYFEIVYGSFLFSNFRNILKQNGKSFVSEKALYRSFFLIMLKVKDNPYLFIFEVLELLRPYLFVKFKTKVSRNKTKLVAFVTHINTLKQYKQGLKWIKLSLLVSVNTKRYDVKLFEEFLNLYIYKSSFLLDKKEEIYKCAITNKFNKHYRW